MGLWFLTAALSALAGYSAHAAQSENLNDLDLLRRCYIRMVRDVPPESDPLFQRVASGATSGQAACLELFDRAQFTTGGLLKNRTSAEAKNIVRTFHDLHMSWFQSKNHGFLARSDILRDIEEPALFYTRAAFLPNTKISTIVTAEGGLQGVRDQVTYPTEISNYLAQRVVSMPAGFDYSDLPQMTLAYNRTVANGTAFVAQGVQRLVPPDSRLVETGALVGIKAASPLILSSFRFVTSNTEDINKSVRPNMANFDANKHFGAGIIGSQSFLMNNVNLTANVLPLEYTNINRRLTARIFEDLMCHTLPTLLDADVASEVKPASEHTFQQTSSCMRCHSGIDGMGFGFRNLVVFNSAANPDIERQTAGVNFSGMAQIPPRTDATTFAATMPAGRLHYRELVTGNRRSQNFTSLADLGAKIAAANDIYTCAAKRYYQFFTGVNVDLTKPATAAVDKVHQDKVLELGKNLKTHQSVRTLLQQIFASPAFRSSNYLTEKSL